MRILVIDDDALLRGTIRKMLESAGHAVVEAPDGRSGLELFGAQPFDAVITDIIMPEKEGIETIREMRKADPAIRIVAMSGGGRTEHMEFLTIAAKLGASATLAKPFRKEQLIACVEDRDAATTARARKDRQA